MIGRRLAQATFVSFLAIAGVEFAVPFIAVSTLGANSATVSALAVARFLPALLVSEAASSYVTRHGFRRAMITAEILRVAAFAVATAGAAIPTAAIPLFVLALALVSVAGTVGGIGTGDAIPYLTEGAARVRMYSRLSIAESSADAIGPFAAGVLLAWLDAPVAFIICGVLAALAIRLFTSLPGGQDLGAANPGTGKHEDGLGIVAGLRINVAEPTIRRLFTWTVAYNLGQSVVMSVFLIAITQDLGLASTEYGVLGSVVVVFAIIGAWWAGRVVTRAGRAGRLFQLTGIITMAAYALIAASFLAPRGIAVVLLAVFLALEEFCSAVAGVLLSGYRAAYVPEALRPGSIAANRAVVALSVVTGYAIGGLLGLHVAAVPLMLATGLIMFAATLVWLTPRSIAVEVDEAHALPGSATDDAPRQST